jgi:tetratricopeptide (TPR) repeat protein
MELTPNNVYPTLCLNMIVKNESKIITRLFDSVINIIDSYCICDTGSTDDTIEIIKTYFASKNIQGVIVNEPFKNFCYNRSYAINSCIGMSDYILLLDADMILEIKNFNKEQLRTFDSCYILQGNEQFYYKNVRIIKNNGLYSYSGVTHEYINTPPNNIMVDINKDQLFIRDYGDGGCKEDKFERDIKLLLDGLIEEPNSARYHFYLANSYHDSNDMNKAIEYYEKRIKIGGWPQEVWYSYYRIGLCYKKMNKISDAIYTWLEGYDYLPERLEGLYEIIHHYRNISKHKLALHFYELAIKILNEKHNIDNYLFLHNDIYKYKLDYEYTIIACYVDIKNINDKVVSILNRSTDKQINNNLLNNMKFYKDILKPIQTINCDNIINMNINFNNNTNNIKLYSSSSCLIPNIYENNNGYLMNVRYVNYFINDNGGYLNCDKNIITINKFVKLTTDFKLCDEKMLGLDFDNRRYIGIEDVRIFNDIKTNELQFIGTGYHKNDSIGIVEGKYDVINNKLIANELNSSFTKTNCEKNWVYVDYNKSSHIIYNWHPLQICKMNEERTLINLVETKKMPGIFSNVRGSTCGFKYVKKINGSCLFNNIYLDMEEVEIWFVVHLVSYENPRHYYHMIVVFDNSMNLLRYSAPFKFEGEPIEYCLSIVVEDDRVLINYSCWDRTTRIGIYDKQYIDSLIKYT